MVSETTEPARSVDEEDESWSRDSVAGWRRGNRGGLRRLIASTVRLADLQLRIWLTEAKITVARILMAAVLFGVAGVMAILGTIFLFIGLFRILTDVIGIPAVWSFLIFALFTFGIAGTVMLIAQKTLSKKAGEPDRKKETKQAEQADKPREVPPLEKFMGLSEQLEELHRQRAEEVRNLHYTYLRTKRDVKRAASPTRFVRKHLALCLAAGAALGLILAPRPSPRPVSEEATERAARKTHRQARRGIPMSWVKRMLMKFAPQAAEFIPDEVDVAGAEEQVNEEAEQIREEGKEEGKKRKKHGALGSLIKILEVLLPLVASKVDWRSLVNHLMHGVYGKMNERGSQNGREPKVSVADAGTVKPQDFENFE